MKKALDYIAGGTMWLPAYDLSTTPPNAEIGLDLWCIDDERSITICDIPWQMRK